MNDHHFLGFYGVRGSSLGSLTLIANLFLMIKEIYIIPLLIAKLAMLAKLMLWI